MTELRAHLLVFLGAALLEAACLLGGVALGERQFGVALGVIIPPVFVSQGVAEVVRHYGEAGRDHR